jgi:putative tryptophan/tyrosine transport system substrate-binding protein
VHRQTIIKQTMQRRLPAVLDSREAVAEGRLMSYAPDRTDIFRRSASYVDRILKGALAQSVSARMSVMPPLWEGKLTPPGPRS